MEEIENNVERKNSNYNWIHVSERLPNKSSGKYLVKTASGNIFSAYFYAERADQVEFCGKKHAYWWGERNYEQLCNVTHWNDNDN